MNVTVYTLTHCPRCEDFKDTLQELSITYREEDMNSPNAIAMLRMAGVFTLEALVLRVDDRY